MLRFAFSWTVRACCYAVFFLLCIVPYATCNYILGPPVSCCEEKQKRVAQDPEPPAKAKLRALLRHDHVTSACWQLLNRFRRVYLRFPSSSTCWQVSHACLIYLLLSWAVAIASKLLEEDEQTSETSSSAT